LALSRRFDYPEESKKSLELRGFQAILNKNFGIIFLYLMPIPAIITTGISLKTILEAEKYG
jgi:hypothetical protein